MTFETDIARFVVKTALKQRDIFVGVANGLKTSITEGSKTTGSPGQPVEFSDLKNSWNLEFNDLFLASITTPIIYARAIEEGQNPRTGNRLTLRSEVGGFNSVRLTRAGFQKLVNSVAREVV